MPRTECPKDTNIYKLVNLCVVAEAPEGCESKLVDQSQWEKFNASISKILDQENSAIARRMGWNFTLQGFLFASYSLSKKGYEFQWWLAFAGMWVAIFALVGILAAYSNINRIKREWYCAAKNSSTLRDRAVQPFANPCPSFWGRVPPLGIAVVVAGVWLKLLC